MKLVLTMAGKYSRFKLFGSKIPKYLLPLGKGTVLSELLINLFNTLRPKTIYMLANNNDQLFYPILKSIGESVGVPKKNIIYISDTRSQLETALKIGETDLDDLEEPIVFTNIDTILRNRANFRDETNNLNGMEGIIDVFAASSISYSYILSEKTDFLVSKVVDYKVVSKLACSGMYGFGSFREMEKIALSLLKSKPEANFTDLYNTYIERGNKVKYVESLYKKDTIVMGTPEEYIINIHKFQ